MLNSMKMVNAIQKLVTSILRYSPAPFFLGVYDFVAHGNLLLCVQLLPYLTRVLARDHDLLIVVQPGEQAAADVGA